MTAGVRAKHLGGGQHVAPAPVGAVCARHALAYCVESRYDRLCILIDREASIRALVADAGFDKLVIGVNASEPQPVGDVVIQEVLQSPCVHPDTSVLGAASGDNLTHDRSLKIARTDDRASMQGRVRSAPGRPLLPSHPAGSSRPGTPRLPH